jgi:mgtE-like transporter
MERFSQKFKEIFSSQLVSIFGGLIAGTFLAVYTDELLMIPGMLILIPGFLEMRGNISGSLASRITSGLFLGIVSPNKVHTKLVRGNIYASFVLVMIVSFALGILACLFNFITLGIFTPKIIIVPIVAAVMSSLIEIPITITATFYLFRKGHDPNNIIGPLVSSTGDVTSILSLIIAMVIL